MAYFAELSNINWLKLDQFSKWNTSQVTDMSGMFYGAHSFNGNLSNWDVSKVTDMSGMFGSDHFFDSDLSKWDVSNVISMGAVGGVGMFDSCSSFNSDLSKWDVSKVIDMSNMFNFATKFTGDLSKWNVSKVSDMSLASMFLGSSCSLCDHVPVRLVTNCKSSCERDASAGKAGPSLHVLV